VAVETAQATALFVIDHETRRTMCCQPPLPGGPVIGAHRGYNPDTHQRQHDARQNKQ
jgi:hypothetical protein